MRSLTDRRVALVLALATLGGFALGYLIDLPCRGVSGLPLPLVDQWCYSDLPMLFTERGLSSGAIPYLDASPAGSHFEYPVLTGMLALATARLTGLFTEGASATATWLFVDLNTVVLLICAMAAVLATAFTVPRRRWDGLMVALAPMAILAGTINWDWLVVALTCAAFFAWSRGAATWTGVLLGLGAAAKFYPAILLIAFAFLAVRSGVWRPTVRLLVAGVATWLVINLPFALLGFEGWSTFYGLGQRRSAEFGSIWLAAFLEAGVSFDPGALNLAATASLLVLLVGIAWLTFAAPRKPRLAQVAFLVMAAFLLTNKVYSPQYVLWLVPLAVLARPRWRDLLIWQSGELVYFAAVWFYMPRLLSGIGPDTAGYSAAIAIRVLATVFLVSLVIRDILRPSCDPVRADDPDRTDDPGGGPFNGHDVGPLVSSATILRPRS